MDGPELVRREPAAPLRGLVGALYGYRGEDVHLVRRREGPGTHVVLVLGFDTEWWVGDAADPGAPGVRAASFVGGLRPSQVLTEHRGRSEGIQVDLTPFAARVLFRVPMHELAGAIVPLEELLGADASRLSEGIHERRSADERLRLMEATLARRLADRPLPPPEVAWAYGRLRRSRGRVRVVELASELGWSRKRLAAAFREHVGLTPKTFARVCRFTHALEVVKRGGLGWAEVALECGYYDQAHLINEFRAFAGTTPARHGAFLQDAAAAGT